MLVSSDGAFSLGGRLCKGRGPELPPDAAALPRPVLSDAAHPRQLYQLSCAPQRPPLRSPGERRKKEAASSGPSGAPHGHALASPVASRLPTGEAWGGWLCWEGPLSPVAGPTLRPSSPEATGVPLPAQCRHLKAPGSTDSVHHLPNPSLPRVARLAQVCSWLQQLGPPGQPLPRPLPPLLPGMPWEALLPQRAQGPQSLDCTVHPTPPLGPVAHQGTGSGGSVSERGPSTEQGAWGRWQAEGPARGTHLLLDPAWPGGSWLCRSRVPRSCLMPCLKQTRVQTLVLAAPEPADISQAARPAPGPGQTESPLHSRALQDSRSHRASCWGSKVPPTGLGSRSPTSAHGSKTRPWELLTSPCPLALAEPGAQTWDTASVGVQTGAGKADRPGHAAAPYLSPPPQQ